MQHIAFYILSFLILTLVVPEIVDDVCRNWCKLIYWQIYIDINVSLYIYISIVSCPHIYSLAIAGYMPEQLMQLWLNYISSKKSLPGCDSCGATWRPLLFSFSFFGKFMIILRVSGQDEGHVRWHKGPQTIVWERERGKENAIWWKAE